MFQSRLRWLIFLLNLMVSSTPVQAQTYVFGLMTELDVGKQENAQLKQLISVAAAGYREKTGVSIVIKTFNTNAELDRYMKLRPIDFLATYSKTALDKGFVPFVQFGFFNEPVSKECVFVHKDSPYKSVKKLRNRSMVMRTESLGRYFDLAAMVQGNPARFFNPLKSADSDASLMFMLAFKEVQGAYISLWPLAIAAKSHPAAARQLRRLECGKACPSFMMAGPRVPAQERSRLAKYLMGLFSEKSMTVKRYLPVFHAIGLTFKPYSLQLENRCRAVLNKRWSGLDTARLGKDMYFIESMKPKIIWQTDN